MTLDCSILGYPRANITWTLNGSVEFLNKPGVFVDQSRTGFTTTFTLTFTNVTSARARGTYACNVFALNEENYKKFNVLVACESSKKIFLLEVILH